MINAGLIKNIRNNWNSFLPDDQPEAGEQISVMPNNVTVSI